MVSSSEVPLPYEKLTPRSKEFSNYEEFYPAPLEYIRSQFREVGPRKSYRDSDLYSKYMSILDA